MYVALRLMFLVCVYFQRTRVSTCLTVWRLMMCGTEVAVGGEGAGRCIVWDTVALGWSAGRPGIMNSAGE